MPEQEIEFDLDDNEQGIELAEDELEFARRKLREESADKRYQARFVTHDNKTGKKTEFWDICELHPLLEAAREWKELEENGFNGWIVAADWKEISRTEYDFAQENSSYDILY